MLLIRQIFIIIILSFYDQGAWRAYRDLAFRSEMGLTKIYIKTSASLLRRNYANVYVPI